MAKLPRTGVAYQLLDEREVTLADIVASLGLKRLSKRAEREIRDRLGFALAMWDEPYSALQIKDVAGALKAHAKLLERIAPLGTITRPGFAREHDIAVGGCLVQVLASKPAIGSVEGAHHYLGSFCDRANTIASSCRAAAQRLQSIKGQGGRISYDWYDEFTAVLLGLCRQNGIKPSLGNDRISGEPVGNLFKIASEFERLLPSNMRSRKPATMMKRLQRSLSRLAKRA
jgi:hypothetical protein